jgi:hypothetical protein
MRKVFLLIILIPFLVACTSNKSATTDSTGNNSFQSSQNKLQNYNSAGSVEFSGTKGEKLVFANQQVNLPVESFDDGQAHYYNVDLDSGKTVYFFVVKDKNGIYRAAANACQVCADSKMGFRQEGDFMVCNTCGNKYPLEKIATEKGGCNPVPISPNVTVEGSNLILDQSEVEQIASYF